MNLCDSPAAVVSALYAAVSFAPGHSPNYESLRALFLPGGSLTVPDASGVVGYSVKSIDEFIVLAKTEFWPQESLGDGFYETEVEQKLNTFGRVAQVFSAYECTTDANSIPFVKGVNCFQLVEQNNRWWILSLVWDRVRL